MKVLVDTPVWSMLLRRRNVDAGAVAELSRLILADQATLIGVVRQEILSGLRQADQYQRVRRSLKPYNEMTPAYDDYDTAAQFSNTCRHSGVQGSNVDFLICAVAIRYDLAIYTTDKDFHYYAKHLPIRLHIVGL